MAIFIEPSASLKQFKNALKQAVSSPDTKSLMILTCDANHYTAEALDPLLTALAVPVFGGIFPAVIHGTEKFETGSVIVSFTHDIQTVVLPDLSEQGSYLMATLDKETANISGCKTMFVFVDGLTKGIGNLINNLFNCFGLENNFIGGGAGSLSLEQAPCIISNQGLLMDAAILGLTTIPSSVGVSHGWRSIAGPLRVTESQGNIIHSLDWHPAFDVYKETIKTIAGTEILRDNFYEKAKAFPFGISKIGAERTVRDPVMVLEDASLLCVGEVPQGTFVDILNGTRESLLDAARNARQAAVEGMPEAFETPLHIFIDCISRVLFLDDDFSEELKAVHTEGQPLVGVCSIGEIANSGTAYLEFFNKTAVLAVLKTITP